MKVQFGLETLRRNKQERQNGELNMLMAGQSFESMMERFYAVPSLKQPKVREGEKRLAII